MRLVFHVEQDVDALRVTVVAAAAAAAAAKEQ